MSTAIIGIVLVAILVSLFLWAANRYNKNLKKLEQHEFAGDDEIILHLKKRHLIGTSYSDNHNCAIAKCLKEHFPNERIEVSVDWASINYIFYEVHCIENGEYKREYNSWNFNEDKTVAESNETKREQYIRTIKLVKR